MLNQSIRVLPVLGVGVSRGERGDGTPRKCVVKVVLSKQQKDMLCELARRLGISESEMLRTALMDYAKELSMIKETVHRSSEGYATVKTIRDM